MMDRLPSPRLTLFSPSGVLANRAALQRAAKRFTTMGFDVQTDPSVLMKHQRFAGTDQARLEALHRVAGAVPQVALATRGGYGLTRLLDQIDWPLMVRSVEQGTRWVGHSDFTALQLALLAHSKTECVTWSGPMACDDFGRTEEEGGVEEVTQACFVEALSGELEAIGFRTEPGFDGVQLQGRLWGGNLCMVMSLLGTSHWPASRITKGGILFLEEVNEHPYRIERSLLQLHQAGVLAKQKAIVLGAMTGYKASPLDRGYNLKTMLEYLRGQLPCPVLTGLPFGHVRVKVMLPVGARVDLMVQGRDALIAWGY
jgi:muramoyltetrapeptide carboxypeptidase